MSFDGQPPRPPVPKEIRDEVYEKFGGHCAYCGIKLKAKGWHCDHVIPVAAGGVDDICNYFPSCSVCNQFKSASSLESFRRILEDQTLKKASFILALRFEQITVHPSAIVFWYEKQGHVFDEALVRDLMQQNPRRLLVYSEDS